MSQPVHGIPLKEINTQKQGRSGSKVPILTGPAKNPKHNPTKGGGINRATKGIGGGMND